MSVSRKLNLSLGLEDDAPNVQVNIDTDEGGMPLDNITEDGEPTPEADEVELNEAADEVEGDSEAIDELQDASEALESIYLSMESAQRDGGLTREAAVFAGHAVQAAMRKFNVSSEEVGISLESFRDNKARATTVSMEGIREALKAIWDKIVSVFQAMMKKIADFWNKYCAAAPHIKRRAEGLRKKARNVTGTQKEKTIATGLFRQLNVAGEVPKAANMTGYIKSVRGVFSKNASTDDLDAFAKKVFSKENLASRGWASSVNELRKAVTTVQSAYGITTSRTVTIAGDNVSLKTSGSLPGNSLLVCDRVKAYNDANSGDGPTAIAAEIRSVKWGVYADKHDLKAKDTDKDKKFETLSASTVEAICDEVIQSMELVIQQKTQSARKENQVKLIKKAGDDFVNDAASDNEDGTKSQQESDAAKVMSAVIDFAKTMEAGDTQVLRYNFNLAKASLAWCARSLSQYKNN